MCFFVALLLCASFPSVLLTSFFFFPSDWPRPPGTKFESIYKKGLPKCEVQLINELTKWKMDYGTDIMIAGSVYLETVKAATENRENVGKNKRQKIKDESVQKYVVPVLPRNTLKPRK